MEEKIVQPTLEEDLDALVEKHKITGAIFILETQETNHLVIHNLSYEDVKDNLCYVNYQNEKEFIEACELDDAIDYMEQNN